MSKLGKITIHLRPPRYNIVYADDETLEASKQPMKFLCPVCHEPPGEIELFTGKAPHCFTCDADPTKLAPKQVNIETDWFAFIRAELPWLDTAAGLSPGGAVLSWVWLILEYTQVDGHSSKDTSVITFDVPGHIDCAKVMCHKHGDCIVSVDNMAAVHTAYRKWYSKQDVELDLGALPY